MADFLTTRAISEVVGRLADQARTYYLQNNLAVLILRFYFEGSDNTSNRKNLEARLKQADEEIGSLGDYPWTCEFEDVLDKYRVKVEKLALEFVVEEAKEMFEHQAMMCFGVEDD